LYAIHRANSHPLRSITIIHGLNEGSTKSWTNAGTKAFWPQDFLPRDVPEAQMVAFGYNAVASFGNATAAIVDHAKDLVGSLIDKREEEDEKLWPIIFIAHSRWYCGETGIESYFHSLLIKLPLESGLFLSLDRISILYNLRTHLGIIFFETLHRGSDKAAYGKILANVALTVRHKPSSKLLSALPAIAMC
jgi:hypothetical protein